MIFFTNKTLLHITSLLSLFVLYNSTHAAPVIDSVIGTIEHGTKVVINGSNFNLNNSPSPLIWDDFEAGTPGSVINSKPQVGSWIVDNRPAPVYSTTLSVSGNQSAFMDYSYPNNQWSAVYSNPLPDSDRFYQSFYFWFSTYGNGQLKLVQVWGDADKGDYAPGFMFHTSSNKWWNNYISTSEGNDRQSYQTIPENEVPAEGKWHHYEMFLQRSSAGNVADGSVEVKINGVTRYNQKNAVTRSNSAYNWKQIWFFHGVTNQTAGDVDAYIDDAYLNNSWARVELCDSPLYSKCLTKVIQPYSSWQDGKIEVTLNKGQFDNINPLYLYIVDANNVVNSNGYPFCRTCPRAPADNSAK